MKKILALILAVTMIATLCVGCGKEEVKNTPTTPPVDTQPVVDDTTPSEDTSTEPQPEEPAEPSAPVEKPNEDVCADIDTLFSVIAFSNYAIDIPEMDAQLNAAIAEKDAVACGEIIANIGQTIILVPHWDGYTYTTESKHCVATSENGEMISIAIAPYTEGWNNIVDNFVLDTSVKFPNHEGELYEIRNGENDSSWTYCGMTDSKMTIAMVAADKEVLLQMAQEMAVIESTLSPAVDFENFKSSLPETEVAAYIEESMAIAHFFFMPTPNDGVGEGALIKFDTTDKIAEQLNKRLAEEYTEIKYIKTQYTFGFAIVAEDNVVFYGFDNDTHNAFTVFNVETIDEIFETVKGINALNGAYFAE